MKQKVHDPVDVLLKSMNGVGFKQQSLAKDTRDVENNRALKIMGVKPLQVKSIIDWFDNDWQAARDIQRLARQYHQANKNNVGENDLSVAIPIGLSLDVIECVNVPSLNGDDKKDISDRVYRKLNVVYSTYGDSSHHIEVYCVHKGELNVISTGYFHIDSRVNKTATVWSVSTRPLFRGLNIAKVVMFGLERIAVLVGVETLSLNATADGARVYETMGYERNDRYNSSHMEKKIGGHNEYR